MEKIDLVVSVIQCVCLCLGHARLIHWMADFSRAFLVQSVGRKYNKKSQEQEFFSYFHDFQSVGR